MINRIILLDTVDSTNNYAKTLDADDFKAGRVVAAKHQTAGRGTFGKQWLSPEGGVYMSITLVAGQSANPARITLLTACSVCDALTGMFGPGFGIKWPNDILLGGKKVCGILTETVKKDLPGLYLVIGIGINLALTDGDLQNPLTQNAGSVNMHIGEIPCPRRVLEQVLESFDRHYGRFCQGMDFLTYYKQKCRTIGKEIYSSTHKKNGVAVDITESGRLLLEFDDGQREEKLTMDN